jgi:hypothetical protein
MGRQRDLRTAHEKFEQNMAEGRRRGFFQLLTVPPPEGIFGGWDHTKKPNRYIYTNIKPVEIRSRGKIPPNVKDDTEDSVTITVTSYHSLLDADQTETCRTAVIQGLPAQKQPGTTDLSHFLKDMKNKDGMLENINLVGGLRWIEWCAWDEEYVWKRYKDGHTYKGYPASFKTNSLTDLGYRNVRKDMEILALHQGIPSWTSVMRGDPTSERDALEQRYHNYMEQLFTDKDSLYRDYLPDSWALYTEGQTQRYSAGDAKPKINKASLPPWWIGQLFHRLELEWTQELEEESEVVENKGSVFSQSANIWEPPPPRHSTVITDSQKGASSWTNSMGIAPYNFSSERMFRLQNFKEEHIDISSRLLSGRATETDPIDGNALYPTNRMQLNESDARQLTQLSADQSVNHITRFPSTRVQMNPVRQLPHHSIDTIAREDADPNLLSQGTSTWNANSGLRNMALGSIGSGRRAPISEWSSRDRYGFSEGKDKPI